MSYAASIGVLGVRGGRRGVGNPKNLDMQIRQYYGIFRREFKKYKIWSKIPYFMGLRPKIRGGSQIRPNF